MKKELKSIGALLYMPFVAMMLMSLHGNAQDQGTDQSTGNYRSNTTTYKSTTTTTSMGTVPDQESDEYRDDDNYARPRAGIKGGVNWSNLIVDEVSDANAKFGFHAGVYGQLFANRAFAIQPEVNYSMKGNEIKSNFGVIDQETKFNLHYIDIPILAVFKLGEVAEIHAGAYWAYLIGANIDTDGDLGDGFSNLDRKNFENWDYGLVGGLGFNVGAIQLGARYNYGLNEIAKSRGAQTLLGSTKNSVGQLYIAFNLAADSD